MATPWVAAGVAWHSFAAARNRSAPAGVGRPRSGRLRVYPLGRPSKPLLLLQTGSELRDNSEQAIFTQLLRYNVAQNRFDQIFSHVTGENNNQEDRFITEGPLQGAVISVVPTQDAPFAYWVRIEKLTPAWAYRAVLRYRSATRYQGENELSVVHPELPDIMRRLGLWRPGAPLPLPVGRQCPKPGLIHGALWCN